MSSSFSNDPATTGGRTSLPMAPRLLSDIELSAVLSAARSPRDLALISLMIGTGLRLAEVPRLEIDCVVRRLDGSGLIYVPSGQHHTGRLVPIGGVVREAIDVYLADREVRTDDFGPLFEEDGQAMTAAQAGLVVLRTLSEAGIEPEGFMYHQSGSMRLLDVFTFCFAERHLRAGGNLVNLGRHLGHRSATATRRLASQVAVLRMEQSNPESNLRRESPVLSRRDTRPIQMPNGRGVTVAAERPSGSLSTA